MEQRRYTGKTVLVTGAGGTGALLGRSAEAATQRRGTGRTIALQFAREGADVVAVDLEDSHRYVLPMRITSPIRRLKINMLPPWIDVPTASRRRRFFARLL